MAQETLSARVVDQTGQALPHAVIFAMGLPEETAPSESPLPEAVMDQKNKQFAPRVLAVTRHQHVAFPNSDNIRHHVYSFSEPKRFELKLYADSPEAPVLFDRPGIVVLGCNIHDNMVGYIFVANSRYVSQTDADGWATLHDLPGRPPQLGIWHPDLLDASQPLALSLPPSDDSTPIEFAVTLGLPTTEPIPDRFRRR